MKEAGDVMKVGMTSVVGHGVLGTMAGLPGMPAAAVGTANVAGAGLRLATLGQVAKSGMVVAKTMVPKKQTKKTKSILDKIW